MKPAQHFAAALGFLTVVGRAQSPSPQAVRWFPVVGALIGAAVGMVWWGATKLWSPLVAAALATSADLVITGALHHDGLADSADGLLPHLDRDRRLAVMRQPDIGTFGALALIAIFALRTGALAGLAPEPLLLAGIWCGSRTAMGLIANTLPYARTDGLAQPFIGNAALATGVFGVLLGAAMAFVSSGGPGLGAVVTVLMISAAVAALAHRRLGGFTGDVLGAAGLLGETGGLLMVAAKW